MLLNCHIVPTGRSLHGKGSDDVLMYMQEIVALTTKAQKEASKRAGGAAGVAVECQPNLHAPLLKDEKGRREWLEREINICNRVT